MTAVWTAQEAAKATGGRATSHWNVSSVVIDSRSAGPDDLFVALKGEKADGHDFVKSALERGAAAMVSHIPDGVSEHAPLLIVKNVFQALCDLAAFNRRRSHAKITAVTGSVGKTSTKEALRAALGCFGRVHASSGNFNNHLGVPISMARMAPDSEFAIFELGMNHSGEIAALTRQVRPHVAIITTVDAVHLEFFDSVEHIADAKAEIFLAMEKTGTAILNRDNPYFERLVHAAQIQGIEHIIGFGAHAKADCRLVEYSPDSDGNTCQVIADIAGTRVDYRLGTVGIHQARNTIAVLAAAYALGQDVKQAAAALHTFGAPEGRGKRYALTDGNKNFTLIDDSYNASPASIRAALEVLRHSGTGRKLAILGDMRELGKSAPILHRDLANDIIANRIDKVITVGPNMRHLYEALPPEKQAGHYDNVDALISCIHTQLDTQDIILVKGSHGMEMFRLAGALKNCGHLSKPALAKKHEEMEPEKNECTA